SQTVRRIRPHHPRGQYQGGVSGFDLRSAFVRRIAVLFGDGEREQDVLNPRAGTDVMNDERSAVRAAIGDEADMRQSSWKRITRQAARLAKAQDKTRREQSQAVIGARLSAAPTSPTC